MPLPDPKDYRHLINNPKLTDEQKDELIRFIWGITSRVVDMVFDNTFPVPADPEDDLVSDTSQGKSSKERRLTPSQVRKILKSLEEDQ